MESFLNNKRLRQRIKIGIQYVTKYLSGELLRVYYLNYSPVKPLDILCDITYRCNLKCPTCFRWTSKPDENELGLKDWENIILTLRKWIGPFNLAFGGGEPFMKKGILDIIRLASKNGIVTSVVSNGSLIDKGLAREIVSSGLGAVSLSLNSLTPEIHNKTRGTDTSFDDVVSAIENLRERKGLRLTVSTTVMRANINDLIRLVEFVKSNRLDGINFQPLMEASIYPTFNKEGKSDKVASGKLYPELRKNMGDVDNVFNRLISMKKAGYPINNSVKQLRYTAKYLKDSANPEILDVKCKIGSKNLFIDPFGNVRLCMIMKPIGNIATESPQKIWSSQNAQRQRKNIRTCQKACRLLNCNFKELDLYYKIRSLFPSQKSPERR